MNHAYLTAVFVSHIYLTAVCESCLLDCSLVFLFFKAPPPPLSPRAALSLRDGAKNLRDGACER